MFGPYTVLDVRPGDGLVVETVIATARSADDAVLKVFGHALVRGNGGNAVVVAKVYFESGGRTTMVRFYEPK